MLLLTSLLAPALKVGTSVRHAHRHRTSLVRSRIESGSTSKGMAKVALVELGSGCCHNTNSTKAAIRACNDAIEWNSVKVTTIIPGGYDALRLHVQIGVPSPETVDMDAVARCFPYGQLLPVAVEEGGLLGSSRAGVPNDEPPEAKMTVAVACVTLGYGVPEATEADNRAAEAEWPAAAFEAAAAPAAEADWAADWAAETSLGEMSAGEALLRGGLSGSPRPLPAGAPTAAEMEPGSEAMLQRAAAAKARLAARVLTPYEVAALICDDEEEEEVEILDVRTPAQRATHEINGHGPLTPRGARAASLDDMVDGRVALPSPEQLVVLVCSRGPKSLVALDWLAEACPRAVCVDGGITAWDVAKLPTESTTAEPPP